MKFKPEQQASRYRNIYTTFEVSAKTLASPDSHVSHLALGLLSILAFLNREAVEEDIFVKAFDECQELEKKSRFVWEENMCQGDQCCATQSTQNDLVTKHYDDPEDPDRFESMPKTFCTWRGYYRRSVETEIWQSEPVEPCSAVQLMTQSSETCKQTNDTISGQAVLPDTVEDSGMSDGPDSGVLSSDNADAKVHELREIDNLISDEGYEAKEDYDNVDGDLVRFCVTDEDYEYYGDGEINSPLMRLCNAVRSSGLVERQKSTRLRASCVRLAELSLVRFDANIISIHPLVHEWARARLGEVARQHAWEQTLSILALAKRNIDRKPSNLRLVPHLDVCSRDLVAEDSRMCVSLNVVRAFQQLAWVYFNDRQYEASLAIFETLFIPHHSPPYTWSYTGTVLMHSKAKCLGALGRYEDMHSCVTQLLQTIAPWSELDSPEAYRAQALLADTYRLTGKLQDGVDLYESLLERNSRTFVLNDIYNIELLIGLIEALRSLGNNERALEMSIEKLRICQRAFPPHAPFLLDCMSNLAQLYIIVGAVDKAITLLEDEVNFMLKQTSRNHLSIELMTTLASAYEVLDQYEQATSILEIIHSYYTRTLSADRCEQIGITCRLAHVHSKLDKPLRATRLLEEVVEIDVSSLQDGSRRVSVYWQAYAYLQLDRPSQAMVLLEEVVAIDTLSLAPNHPERADGMHRLAQTYLRLDKPNEAIPLLEEVVQTDASDLFLDSEVRLEIMIGLAQAYRKLNKLGQAVLLLKQVADAVASDPSPNNPERLDIMFDLAEEFLRLDETVQAVMLLEELVELHEDTNRLRSIRRLARAYTKLGTCEKIQEAVSLLEGVMDQGKETLHADPEVLRNTQRILAAARKKLRRISGEQSPVDSTKAQETPEVKADEPLSGSVYRHIRNFTKSAALMF